MKLLRFPSCQDRVPHWSSNRTISFTLEKTSSSWIECPFRNTIFSKKMALSSDNPSSSQDPKQNMEKWMYDLRFCMYLLQVFGWKSPARETWPLFRTPIESPHRLLPLKINKMEPENYHQNQMRRYIRGCHTIYVQICMYIYISYKYTYKYIYMYISYVDHTSSSKPPFWLPW